MSLTRLAEGILTLVSGVFAGRCGLWGDDDGLRRDLECSSSLRNTSELKTDFRLLFLRSLLLSFWGG